MDADPSRFVSAQQGSYEQALAELRAGSKRSHWIWFVFPQVAGLGLSAMSQRYAIGSPIPYSVRGCVSARPRCSGTPTARPSRSSAASTR